MENSAATSLYDLLVTKDFDPELLDSSGKSVTDPTQAELFSFDWKTPNKNYGTVVVLLGNDNNLEIFYGDNLGRAMEREDRGDWYDFLAQMKNFATRNLLTFDLQNLNRLKYTMQGMAAIKEGLFEGYYGTRKVSYSDQPRKTRLMIKHNRNLGENEARYRAIESIYVETVDGERFKVPSKSLMHGRMLARHVAEGGTPYDAFGAHMTQTVNEINTLARFIRAARAKELGDDAKQMIETAIRHYGDLKQKARRMISQRGYRLAKEEFDPAHVNETEAAVDEIRNMFLEKNLDVRIEDALPILSRIKSKPNSELDEFESWADSVAEGTWALPDQPESKKALEKLVSEPLSAGPDAVNAIGSLSDVIGDDELYDILHDVAERDPDADIWKNPRVLKRLGDLGVDIKEKVPAQEDLDTDGVMMTRPSNMSSESQNKDGLKRIVELAKK